MWHHHIHLTMEGTNPLTMSQLLHLTFHFDHVRMAQHLHLIMEGTNPLTMSEGLSADTSLPLGRNLDLENTKLLSDVLKLQPSQWLSQHISYLFVCHNILELHYSPLHHIPDIVILDLDML